MLPDNELLKKYADRYSTVLLMPGSKKAAVSKWAEGSEKHIHTRYVPREANLGLICGSASNLMVVDIDKPEAFDLHVKRYNRRNPGNPFRLEDFRVIKSPKGYHVYFQYDHDLANCVKVARLSEALEHTGCELLLERAYVVAPGSVLKDGRRYEILHNGPVQEKIPPFILLPHIRKLVAKKEEDAKRIRELPVHRKAANIHELFERCRMPEKLQEHGKRNAFCYWFAGVMQTNGLCTEEDIHEACTLITKEINPYHPPLSYREAFTTVSGRIHRQAI